MTTIGIIGLGNIGRRFAASVQDNGDQLIAFDIADQAFDAVPWATRASSPAEAAARAEVVFICVFSPEQVREVITGENGILAGADRPLAIVVTSTIDIETLRDVAEACAERGVQFVDCGVTTIPGMPADSPRSVFSLIGSDTEDEELFARIESMSAGALHCGGLGAGMATKIARNLVTYGSWVVAAAAGRLLEAAGVAQDALIRAINHADPDGRTMFMLEREIGFDEETRPQRERIAELVEKDLSAAVGLARSHGVDYDFAEFVIRTRAELLRLGPDRARVEDLDNETRYERGRRWVDRVYGPGFHDANIVNDNSPYNTETVEHLFGEIWSRPGLSLRERRILVMGASAQLGRGDLVETQVYGGLVNREFSEPELEEIVLQLTPYIGWGKISVVNRGVRAAIRRVAEQDDDRTFEGVPK